MKLRSVISFLWLLVISFGLASCKRGISDDKVAVLETSYGRIVIELLPDDAPKHVANFRDLIENGFYDGTRFHRVVTEKAKLVAIQGGDPNTIAGDPATWGNGQPGQRTVQAEFSKTLKHVRTTVSAARKQNDLDSATSQFFICASSEPQWDGKYSIFGRVIDGMNVVDTIAKAPLFANSDRPLDPVVIKRAYLARRGDLR
jgi:cyclophilin family peptidyl-prolyl cis-trans isomerase